MYYQKLALPFEFDVAQYVDVDQHHSDFAHWPIDTPAHPELLELLRSVDLAVSHSAVFYSPPERLLRVHIDGVNVGHWTKLNFVYGGGPQSRMFWYELKPGHQVHPAQRVKNMPYSDLSVSSCILKATAVIDAPTLINAGQPHSLLNSSSKSRWALSLVLRCARTNNHIDMYQAQQRFQGYLL
jgi:hypothetical protein